MGMNVCVRGGVRVCVLHSLCVCRCVCVGGVYVFVSVGKKDAQSANLYTTES